MHVPKRFLVLTLASITFITGCGQKRDSTQISSDTTTTPAAPAAEPASSSVPSWVAELRQGELALGRTIEQGQMGDVHDHAVRLQALVKQIAGQAGSLTPEQRQQFDEHSIAATRLTDELHEAGDSGDLTKAKAKFKELHPHLRAIEGVFGVSQP